MNSPQPGSATATDGQVATPSSPYGAPPGIAGAGDHHHDHAAEKSGQAAAVDPFQIRASTGSNTAQTTNDWPAQATPPRDGLAGNNSNMSARADRLARRPRPGPTTARSERGQRPARIRDGRGSDPTAYQCPFRLPTCRATTRRRLTYHRQRLPRCSQRSPRSRRRMRCRGADPTAAPQPFVADAGARKAGQYVVQPNDNYWTISEKVYGSGAYFKAIFEYNRNRHPQADRLQVGEALDTPDATVLQRTYPDLCPKATRAASAGRVVPASARMTPGTRVYTVEEGDTLFEIARRQLGKPSRWGEIYQLNRDTLGSDFDYLAPGTELLLPTDGMRVGNQSHPGRTGPIRHDAALKHRTVKRRFLAGLLSDGQTRCYRARDDCGSEGSRRSDFPESDELAHSFLGVVTRLAVQIGSQVVAIDQVGKSLQQA